MHASPEGGQPGSRAAPQPGRGPAAPAVLARTLPSSELLQGNRSVEILHNGAVYRLQATRLGKLILTK